MSIAPIQKITKIWVRQDLVMLISNFPGTEHHLISFRKRGSCFWIKCSWTNWNIFRNRGICWRKPLQCWCYVALHWSTQVTTTLTTNGGDNSIDNIWWWQQYWQTSQYRANLWLCWLGWWPTIRILALPLLKKSSQRCVPSWWMVSGWSSHHHHQHNHYHQPLGASTVSQPNAWRPSTELTSTPSTQEPHRWEEGSPENMQRALNHLFCRKELYVQCLCPRL